MVYSTISVNEFVKEQVEENRRLWYTATDRVPGFGRSYGQEEKKIEFNPTN